MKTVLVFSIEIVFYYFISQVIKSWSILFRCAGLPHGQEKSGKTKKNGGFWKKSGNFYFKQQILSVQTYKIPYILIYSIGKKN